MTVPIARRKFVVALAGAASWPLAARAQQGNRVRRIGVLMSSDENDPEHKRRLSAFIQALAGLGWTDGRNVRMDLRWGGDDINRIRALAQESVGLQIVRVSRWTATVGAVVLVTMMSGRRPTNSCASARIRLVSQATGFPRCAAKL